ncbi:unnamed protein product [Dibothriocephalus latus]|uniref:HEAT repeat protein n=1 Tax=Dibothriocephalus latus TaxID=60516 RepID=A0A3P7LBT7_DIBLA|nr:unnamed protein product [Dibothriocephalus latus]
MGNLINVFPAEVRDCGYPDLMAECFLNNLSDSIPSVRQGAATSIAKVLQTAGDPALETRATEPWERCDGAIRLIGELASLAPRFVTDTLIDKMVSAAAISHYPHYPYLLETACRTIGFMCTGLDKAMFKRNLDSLLPVLAWAVSSGMPLAVSAAEDCLATLSQKLGPNVLRSRVANHFEVTTVPRLLEVLPPIPY